MLNKLSLYIKKYSGDSNSVNIYTDETKSKIVDKLSKKFKNYKINEKTSYTSSVFIYNKIDQKQIKFINDLLIKNSVVALIVNKDFDFNNLVQTTVASSIDTISWHGGHKFKYYFVILNK